MATTALEPPVETATVVDRPRTIGAILVAAGLLTPANAEKIQIAAVKSGIKFGDAAIRLKLATSEDIEFALGRQYNYPILSYGPQGNVSSAVVAAYKPQYAIVESLRTLRSRLALGWLNNADRNVLAIVSPQRGDGRSWFAANLATVFAQAGQRTLLIDADMRHPGQHKLFNLSNEVGLCALLTGRAGPDIAHRVHRQLSLLVIPTGGQPPNPQELLTGQAFEVILNRFASQVDLIIIDTPAAIDSADAEILAARAGAAVILSRRGHTRPARLRSTMDGLIRSGVKVIGSVFNERPSGAEHR
jgi:protein-tyrosine kinase